MYMKAVVYRPFQASTGGLGVHPRDKDTVLASPSSPWCPRLFWCHLVEEGLGVQQMVAVGEPSCGNCTEHSDGGSPTSGGNMIACWVQLEIVHTHVWTQISVQGQVYTRQYWVRKPVLLEFN